LQTGKILRFPVVLFGSSYWSGLVGWLRDRVLADGKVGPEDLDMFRLCHDVDEAIDYLAGVRAGRPDGRVPADEPVAVPRDLSG